jgi:hypothetical protein
MSSDREITRVVRAWLEEGATKLPDRVLDSVLDQLPTVQQRRAAWPAGRFEVMTNNMVRIGLAAAVLLGVAFIGLYALNGSGVGGPGPSENPPTPSSAAVPFPAAGVLEPGIYAISDPFPVEVELTLTETWDRWTPGVGSDATAIYQGSPDPADGRVIVFAIVDNVYADPCDLGDGLLEPPLGPTVADLAAALAGQPGTDSTEPVDVAISGYSGVYLDYTYTGECGTLNRWPSQYGNRQALLGERDQVWILDVEGVRLVIDAASFSRTEEADLAEMRTIIESLTIRP